MATEITTTDRSRSYMLGSPGRHAIIKDSGADRPHAMSINVLVRVSLLSNISPFKIVFSVVFVFTHNVRGRLMALLCPNGWLRVFPNAHKEKPVISALGLAAELASQSVF